LKRNIAVGSTNPVKLEAVKAGFRSVILGDELAFVSVEAASGVSIQPMGDAETRQGAENRALAARNAQPDADFGSGWRAALKKRWARPGPCSPLPGW
jgi:Uncharacterized conserved protein